MQNARYDNLTKGMDEMKSDYRASRIVISI